MARSIGVLAAATLFFPTVISPIVAQRGGQRATQRAAQETRVALRPTHYALDMKLDLVAERLTGRATITVKNAAATPVREASFLLYRLMSVSAVRNAAGNAIPFSQRVVVFKDDSTLQVTHLRVPLSRSLAKGDSTTLQLDYHGALLGYVETGMLYVQDRIDTAYTLIRDDAYAYPISGWPSRAINRAAGLPSYSYDAHVTVPATHRVANGGQLVSRTTTNGWTTYAYRNIKPAWRMDFATARFGELTSGTFHVFHLPADSAGAARILDAMNRTMALYARWFGTLKGGSAFSIIEIPDGWGSQADVTSILQAAAAFRDPKQQYELYHELSHLWNVRATEEAPPRWNEGLATFLQELTTDSIEGQHVTDDRAESNATWLRNRLAKDTRLKEVAPINYGKAGMTDYAYREGEMFFNLLYRIVGHARFTQVIRDYYAQNVDRGASTEDFIQLAKRTSPVNLDAFFDDWMYTAHWANRVAADSSFASTLARYRSK